MDAALSLEDKREVANAIKAISRLRLLPFIKWTKPDYHDGWFHHVVCEKLDKFLQDVIDKKSPRLMLFAPPRHGKSEIVSRRFPAFALGKFPDLAFIATSYSNDLASMMNRDVQKIIDSEEYHDLFPKTTLSGKSVRTVTQQGSYLRNSEIFEVCDHKGIYKSAGVGTGVTGRGGHILMIDDPVKDAQEAYSPTTRQSVWDWYETTLKTRCEPGGGILLIMTRWHEDDLAGRLLRAMAKGGETWDVVKFPAVAEEDEDYRNSGEPLHAERYPIEALNRIRYGSGERDEAGTGSRVWASLYQQRPSAAEGTIFRREHWQYFKAPPRELLMAGDDMQRLRTFLQLNDVIQYWDTAAGGKQSNDYSACVTLGISKSRYYVLDLFLEKIEYPEMERAVQTMFDKWHPSKVAIEGGGSSSGKTVIQSLVRKTKIPLFEIVHSTDKVLRANVISPIQEAGLVSLPEGAKWVHDFVESCATFPNTANDDDVDAFMGALETATQKRKPMQISDSFLAAI